MTINLIMFLISLHIFLFGWIIIVWHIYQEDKKEEMLNKKHS